MAEYIKFVAGMWMFLEPPCDIIYTTKRKRPTPFYHIDVRKGRCKIMKFFDISNTGEFFNRVLRCSGEIHTIEPDGSEKDLKSMAEYLTRTGMASQMKGFKEINLKIQKPADIDILFSYAMEMGRMSA